MRLCRQTCSRCFLVLAVLAATAAVSASEQGPVKFVMHRVGQFRSEACNVGDFNNDGKLDIVAGPYWYEAPDWKPHKFRELRGDVNDKGEGYYDDFMNAPLDVDGDGWLDVISCCWFAKRMEWYRNTGPGGGEWPMAVGEENGNYEMGGLCDIDGDGKKLEILPATLHTRWFEIGTKKDAARGLIGHTVSLNSDRYGSGVGDINGDGRPDILRPNAWYEAPADLRHGVWKQHPLALGSLANFTEEQFRTLHEILGGEPAARNIVGRSEHTPQILVYDVDADGLNDIVTSSAHRYGIFWYQQKNQDNKVLWKQHVIDKSWSQAHSLTLADIDGDEDLDLATGKRFLAHNGHDPGAHEPLGVYWYELKRSAGGKTEWAKHVISYDQGIGSGLNIPVVDLDADGDLDIVVTGKWAGPVYFENTRCNPPAAHHK